MSVSSPSKAITIYIAYDTSTPDDKELFDQLTNHLSPLRRQYPSYAWYNSAISAGSPINRFIEARLNSAHLTILLISANFLASQRCYESEMQRALALSNSGAARPLSPTENLFRRKRYVAAS